MHPLQIHPNRLLLNRSLLKESALAGTFLCGSARVVPHIWDLWGGGIGCFLRPNLILLAGDNFISPLFLPLHLSSHTHTHAQKQKEGAIEGRAAGCVCLVHSKHQKQSSCYVFRRKVWEEEEKKLNQTVDCVPKQVHHNNKKVK